MTAPVPQRWRTLFADHAAAERYLSQIADPIKREETARKLGMDEVAPAAPQTLPPTRPRPAQEFQAPVKFAPTSDASLHLAGSFTLSLPYPPSVNAYWRSMLIRYKPKNPHDIPYRIVVFVSTEGRTYRKTVRGLLAHTPRTCPPGARLAVHVDVSPPDRRARDLDNLGKGLLDALTVAGIWADDSLIDRLTFERRPVVKGGRVDVVISPLSNTLFQELS
ncbi:RusA family crossover junction endodeoxyribonuclease [Deinococcus ruber]|uniref:Uncharacterized protein n=1 Tax=Deinococcus ruber TaxID=1848197 RepID=A0A918CM32_9DEIO|nr:RusA family crossover junction endodeoxyribonuclease [Deinococcus ruber]GGR31312.1 hypothetical protein GCM10008957_47490 [Deinococcus ruber]